MKHTTTKMTSKGTKGDSELPNEVSVGPTEAQHEAQVVPREVRVGLKMLKCSRRR